MHWRRGGLIFQPDGDLEWMSTHATMPIPELRDNGRLRLYFSTRDSRNRSFPAWLEVDAREPGHVLHVCERPLLQLGPPGTFDDSGIMVSSIVPIGDETYLYYIGWNQGISVPYRLAIGLAISRDGGDSFEKYALGPICDRGPDEPFFCTTPHVLHEGHLWRMWYSSCSDWQAIGDRMEPLYHVRYAESVDGIHWTRHPSVSIDYDAETDAIARPFVFCREGTYAMLYSARKAHDYRSEPVQAYRLGYAESADGVTWTKREQLAGLRRSDSGWDAEMIAYPACMRLGETTYLFYNGNGFGRSGLGYAVLDETE